MMGQAVERLLSKIAPGKSKESKIRIAKSKGLIRQSGKHLVMAKKKGR